MDESDILEPDGGGAAPEAAAPPRENAALFGHEAAEAALLGAFRSGRLPHAWLFAGPRGVGKATLAFRFARFLLAQPGPVGVPSSLAIGTEHPVFRRVASGGHPDLLVVERGVDPKRNRLRSDIVVEETRAIATFLRLTPAEGGARIVILDGADRMNRNAANALLKILEEPPPSAVLLLTSDNPGRLLPTLRSRCRRLVLKPLSDALVEEALARYRPDLPAAESCALARLAEGSIGQALDLAASGGLALYRDMVRLLGRLPALDGAALHALADRLARSESEESFRLLAELLPGWIGRMVAGTARGAHEHAVLPEEGEAMRRLAGRRGLDHWVEVWDNLTHLFALADDANLDRKQVVLNAFFALEAASRAGAAPAGAG